MMFKLIMINPSTKNISTSSVVKFIVLLWFCFHNVSCQKQNTLTVQTFKISKGWGYTIKKDNKILIKQSIIPVLPALRYFKNEDEALKVGHLVAERIKNNLAPGITRNDLILLKIEIDE